MVDKKERREKGEGSQCEAGRSSGSEPKGEGSCGATEGIECRHQDQGREIEIGRAAGLYGATGDIECKCRGRGREIRDRGPRGLAEPSEASGAVIRVREGRSEPGGMRSHGATRDRLWVTRSQRGPWGCAKPPSRGGQGVGATRDGGLLRSSWVMRGAGTTRIGLGGGAPNGKLVMDTIF